MAIDDLPTWMQNPPSFPHTPLNSVVALTPICLCVRRRLQMTMQALEERASQPGPTTASVTQPHEYSFTKSEGVTWHTH